MAELKFEESLKKLEKIVEDLEKLKKISALTDLLRGK